MITMFVKHRVNDYDQWKSTYDGFSSVRGDRGVIGAAVFADVNDDGVVIVTHDFDDLDSALAFANSEDLKDAMGRAGVAGPPEFWFGEELERTDH